MTPIRFAPLAASITAVLIVAGCSDNGVNPKAQSSTDRQAITSTLALESQFLYDGTLDDETTTNLAPSLRGARGATGVSGVASAAVDPFSFYRRIAERSIAFEFAFSDTDSTNLPTTAVVTVNRTFHGTFNIIPRDPSHPELPDPDANHIIHKPLLDRWVRYFLFKRVDPLGGGDRRWRLASASAVEVTSDNATSAITSVRLRTSTRDTTLTDPSALIALRQVLRFTPEDTVQVTVTTPRPDDVVLLYHHDRRERLANNGDGTYSGKFRAGLFSGWRHFAVNALSHGTLYDDVAPYDSKAWIYPYVVAGGPLVDYLP